VKTRPSERDRSWLIGELILVSLLAIGTVLLFQTGRLDGYALPNARIALDTAVAMMASTVAVLAATRFLVEGRAMDLLLAGGFFATGIGTFAFAVAPAISGDEVGLGSVETWAALGASLFGAALIAAAPFVSERSARRKRALFVTVILTLAALGGIWLDVHYIGLDIDPAGPNGVRSPTMVGAYGLLALLSLVAVVGFGLRYRRYGRDLDSWLTLALTLIVFADLNYVLAPLRSIEYVLPSDLLRLIAFGVLLAGVARAIGQAEFGRAVAEERARVARDIHDGLAQYLFAISAQISMLETGAKLDTILPRLKFASTAAQQEAQFAVLALSSASGSAPFDSALRRYVEFLVADGKLDVEMEIDPAVTLGPDEEIEIFRIVQEGLANVRKHAGAENATVSILQRNGSRVVVVSDDGTGIALDDPGAGQGLKNMRSRAASIEGVLSMRSAPGEGTSIEVLLRPI
jgi:signal transduction histidine kinase